MYPVNLNVATNSQVELEMTSLFLVSLVRRI